MIFLAVGPLSLVFLSPPPPLPPPPHYLCMVDSQCYVSFRYIALSFGKYALRDVHTDVAAIRSAGFLIEQLP